LRRALTVAPPTPREARRARRRAGRFATLAVMARRVASLPPSHLARFGEGIVPPRARLREHEVEEWLARTRASAPATRARAVQALCPCHVRGDAAAVWDRLLEMVADPDPRVRGNVFHALTDGSPRRCEAGVLAAAASLEHDPDPKLRRRVRRFLAQYRRTGRVNVG
jgi:hypothetical protein